MGLDLAIVTNAKRCATRSNGTKTKRTIKTAYQHNRETTLVSSFRTFTRGSIFLRHPPPILDGEPPGTTGEANTTPRVLGSETREKDEAALKRSSRDDMPAEMEKEKETAQKRQRRQALDVRSEDDNR